ncbi:MAG TPA: H-type small acid-soluble spore protein [Bacillota bacterium]|nr:H-type small acid-soluble spore protein [Bacillota bacterium]HPT88190.1 H-type small acid-soluble spore protein [Bacillota bacterium]
MDYQRAKEIMESHGVISVSYENAPVWLEQLHADRETAEVINLFNDERLEVPLENLMED